MTQKMDLIFFGMQGAGKGTLGKEIAKKFNYKIFETGEQLRTLSQENSELGRKIKEIIESGNLVSNEVVMEIVKDFLKKLEKNTNILFDGIPRSIEQAKTLNDLLKKEKRNYKAILIKISKETALERLTTRRICSKCKFTYPKEYKNNECNQIINGTICGGDLITRKDDTNDAIQQRLKTFEEITIPAIETYKENLITIDGEPEILEVYKNAEEVIKNLV